MKEKLQEIRIQETHIRKLEFRFMRSKLDRENLYRGDPRLLMTVAEHDGQTQIEIAKKLCVKPATLTVMLKRMESAGLIIRRPSPKDQRSQLVYITEEGKAVSERTRELLTEAVAEIYEGLTEEELAAHKKILEKIRGNLERLAGEEPGKGNSAGSCGMEE
ncbi:MAG: MarR family transcriptional regulator [Eubacteriales bacterium]|nr:MarR family transcriptional regulator [Eubacteriales bacterium]